MIFFSGFWRSSRKLSRSVDPMKSIKRSAPAAIEITWGHSFLIRIIGNYPPYNIEVYGLILRMGQPLVIRSGRTHIQHN